MMIFDLLNYRIVDSQCGRDLSVGEFVVQQLPNLSDQLRGHDFRVPPLPDFVGNVVLLGTKKEVVRVATSGVVATVANKHSRRDFSSGKSPRNSMSAVGGPLRAAFSDPEIPITGGLAGAGPVPALAGTASHNFPPESLCHWSTRSLPTCCAFPATKSALAPMDELTSAAPARQCHGSNLSTVVVN